MKGTISKVLENSVSVADEARFATLVCETAPKHDRTLFDSYPLVASLFQVGLPGSRSAPIVTPVESKNGGTFGDIGAPDRRLARHGGGLPLFSRGLI